MSTYTNKGLWTTEYSKKIINLSQSIVFIPQNH